MYICIHMHIYVYFICACVHIYVRVYKPLCVRICILKIEANLINCVTYPFPRAGHIRHHILSEVRTHSPYFELGIAISFRRKLMKV